MPFAVLPRFRPASVGPVTFVLALYARFRRLIRDAGRFCAVGLAGLVVTNGGANLLTYRVGLNAVSATAIAIVASTALTFPGNRYWTFRHRERSGAGRESVLFFALNAVGIGISGACVGITYPFGLARDGLAYNVALNGGNALATLFRYRSYKRWVWPAAPATPAAPAAAAARAPRPARLLNGWLGLLARETTRFAAVGAVGLLITGAGVGLLRFGLAEGPLTSVVTATAAALAVTYSGHRYFTFRHRQRRGVPREGVRFLALNAAGLAVQLGCIELASYVLGPLTAMAYVIALVTGVALTTALRYWSYRTWVWPARPASLAAPRPQLALS
jgi:putative flippase GtrA